MRESTPHPANALSPCSDCGNYDPHNIVYSPNSGDISCWKTNRCLKEMAAIYWAPELEMLPQQEGVRFIAISDCEQIKRFLLSNSAATWGNGVEIEDGWIQLALFSPGRHGERQTMFVCQKNLVPDEFQQFVKETNAVLNEPTRVQTYCSDLEEKLASTGFKLCCEDLPIQDWEIWKGRCGLRLTLSCDEAAPKWSISFLFEDKSERERCMELPWQPPFTNFNADSAMGALDFLISIIKEGLDDSESVFQRMRTWLETAPLTLKNG